MKFLVLTFCFFIISCGGGDSVPSSFMAGDTVFNSCADEQFCNLFLSATVPNGNIGGITGADSVCNNDANKPNDGSEYKALIVDGVSRVACITDNCIGGGVAEHTDWVLLPTKEYRRVDNTTVIGTTNAAGIFVVESSGVNKLDNSVDSIMTEVWTGFTTLSIPSWVALSDNCNDWSSVLPSFAGAAGESDDDRRAFGGSILGCNFNTSIYCVEQ